MSSKPQSAPPTGLSKSAAKKRAKKASKSAQSYIEERSISGDIPITTASSNLPPSVAPPLPPSAPDSLDPSLFNFSAPGSYPVDVQYDQNGYYDEVDVPLNPHHPHHQHPNSFTGSYSIDYNLSLQNGGALAGLSAPFNITHDDLISAANELYKRMADPEFGADDTYWSSLPPHLRQFIRDAVPFNGSIGQNTPGNNSGQRTMYQMAQQIVQAASHGMGLSPGMGANLMSGVNGMATRQFNQPSIGEELGFRRHPDGKDEEYDDEEDYEVDEPEYHAPNGDAPKKKNKKKKKKNAASKMVDPPPAPIPPPTTNRPQQQPPPRQPVPPQPPMQQQQHQQPALNPPPPPVTPAPAHPPPSSRAAGKQPMSNNNAPSSNPPARSARAAGKAPASAAPAHNAHSGHNHSHPPASSKPAAKGKAPAAPAPPAKIWTQSSAEDRENIRLFWLGLSEAERRDLLRIEKDAVLRKMKEQHRHSCGCAVCGRKKVNIEMELDQLYEQYYDELRSYAAEQRAAANGIKPPPSGAGPFPGSVEVDSSGVITRYDHRAPDPMGEHDHDDLDGEESEEYDDEDEYGDEDELDDEEIGSDEADVGDDLDDQHPPPPVSRQAARPPPPSSKASQPRPEGGDDFLSFGSSLATIKGGILTIADDMLKNDGSKFLEMMEQLAIRRSVREDQNIRDMQEETDDEDDESKDEPLTDAERMEEGKRMFQIFAARMFEQRVLQAYREKVAKQREEQLLRELEEEEDSKRAREEKKAKESQKKKDKKKMQKQKADEEKAAREAAIAEEQRAAKARAEEQERERHRKQEEERARREAVKKAAQEEAQRQATERKKRQQEEKEREEEAAKKKRERDEKAKKEREAREKEAKEREKREREEKLAREKAEKERLAKEKAEKAERDKIAKEAKDKAEKERLAKLEQERAEKAKRDEIERKEKEAAEQAKALAAQQAQRERVKAEKAAAERAAASERAAAEKRAAAAAAAASVPTPPLPVGVHSAKSPRNGPTPQTTPPVTQPSPVKAARPPSAPIAAGSSSVVGGRTQKTPQPYYPQPIPPVGVNAFQRMPVPQTFSAGGFRAGPSYTQSPAFSPPQTNGPSISPNPPPRGFAPEPSPPFDHSIRTAPIGMGFPPVKPTARIPSVDDAFSPSTAPIGSTPVSSSSRHVSAGEIGSIGSGPVPTSLLSGSSALDDYRPSPGPAPGAIGVGVGAIGAPGPIGRPGASSAFLEPQTHQGGSSLLRSNSPAQPEQVFGSAALGGDDEIVQPQQRRNLSNGGWDVPVAAAPGSGRWSSSPSIWGSSAPGESSIGGVGAPGVGGGSSWGQMPTIGERHQSLSSASSGPPPGLVGAPVTGIGSRQPSFGNFSIGTPGQIPNQPLPQGFNHNHQNLFSPNSQHQLPHSHHH
ncbi:hypothetical protein I302_100820 [Kwoniella bestiolae CBS 10118]|uniref:Stress response protein NST1 n=1 Tax=Kwoniella bestiolae CBS 10118 TaxID=1296100 RepID=A0AAJ8K138_9TREE